MESIDKKCTPLKREYDDCFNKWYSEKFLDGKESSDCTAFFKTYQKCLREALKEQGLTKMIDDARPAIGSVFSDMGEDK
ncbi:Mitochondrial distribution and morphology protein 35 [Coemansia aciculifera]|uniref:Mitochondrial distribution and morphology protein 35 n=2 Tax=Coemansia TaxID=4863 RepID=A0A9W8H2L7_9FUNG|nr:Mitochondrial distribution and morphology protein 35 [Coemansia pectinata]KAJ2866121.1 Mitochondrial distribution and morphology protein 35 [Coemansia aciculifera]KAJ2875547.1 Mitochondrial distribution and morphology protein 35 [Coemansia aciculifera]